MIYAILYVIYLYQMKYVILQQFIIYYRIIILHIEIFIHYQKNYYIHLY